MFGLILSAVNSALIFVFRSIVVKFSILFGLFFIVQEFIPVLLEFMAQYLNIDLLGYFYDLPGEIWFFLNYFNLSFGFNVITSAIFARFIIRRLPVIG